MCAIEQTNKQKEKKMNGLVNIFFLIFLKGLVKYLPITADTHRSYSGRDGKHSGYYTECPLKQNGLDKSPSLVVQGECF